MKTKFTIAQSPEKSLLYRAIKVVVGCWYTCFYQGEVFGKNHLPTEGPVIILPKHQYWTDIPLVGLAFRKTYLYYIAKIELFRFPLIRKFLSALGGIPIDRKIPIKSLDSFKHLSLLLRERKKIVIFPEGTYYRGTVGRGKSGIIKLILRFQEKEYLSHPIPFLPVGIAYRKKGLRQKVTITIGEPLYAQRGSEAEEFTQEIIKAIAGLSGLEANGEKG